MNSSVHTGELLDTYRCPDCHLEVRVMRFPFGDTLLHPLPTCSTYDRLTAEAYGELLTKSVA